MNSSFSRTYAKPLPLWRQYAGGHNARGRRDMEERTGTIGGWIRQSDMCGSLLGTEDVYWYTPSSHREAALPTFGRYR